MTLAADAFSSAYHWSSPVQQTRSLVGIHEPCENEFGITGLQAIH